MLLKRIFIYLCFGLLVKVSAQKTVYYNALWEKCKKKKAVYYRDFLSKDSLGRTKVCDYFLNGTLHIVGTYSSIIPTEVKDGAFKYYARNGAISRIEHYQEGRKTGSSVIYDTLTGNVVRLENYEKGKLHGTFKTFYPNGERASERQFNDGKELSRTCYNQNGEDTLCCGDYLVVPTFRGKGQDAYSQYFKDNFVLPANIEKVECKITCLVNKDGSIELASVSNKVSKKLYEAIETFVIENSEGFKPAYVDCKPVKSKVSFTLNIAMQATPVD